MQIQIFLMTFPVCVPNTGDNDVMYLKRIKLTLKTEKETQCLELIVLVNRCKIYVYINPGPAKLIFDFACPVH